MLIKNLILTSAGIFFLMFTSFAQEADPYLSKIFVAQVDETVYMRWTITAGNTCDDTYIERSEDGVTFERIGVIGGICGSPDQAITYDFTDTLPLPNRISYYRLQLGFLGYSSPESLEFIRFNEENYFLGPNPFNDFTRIYFNNDENNESRLILYDINGRLIMEKTTSGQDFIIRREDIESGNYVFRLITGDHNTISGKIIAY